jgi:uncharacterized phiE125 gp8 family phage protein
MTSFTLLTPPAVEPVLLADMKAQARIDTTADDALATGLITAARQWAERYTGRAFITQTWRLWLDGGLGLEKNWWDGVEQGPVTILNEANSIQLPRPPLASVSNVQTFDNTDTGTVWDPGNYYVDTASEPGRIALRLGCVWPVPLRLVNGIMIEYVAGYGNDGSSVPEPIKLAIKQLATHWYENRGEAAVLARATRDASSSRATMNVPLVIQALLDPYRILRF